MLASPTLSAPLKSLMGNGKKIKRENKFQVSPRHFVLIENIEMRSFSLVHYSFLYLFVTSFSAEKMNNCWKSRNPSWKVLPPSAPNAQTVPTIRASVLPRNVRGGESPFPVIKINLGYTWPTISTPSTCFHRMGRCMNPPAHDRV